MWPVVIVEDCAEKSEICLPSWEKMPCGQTKTQQMPILSIPEMPSRGHGERRWVFVLLQVILPGSLSLLDTTLCFDLKVCLTYILYYTVVTHNESWPCNILIITSFVYYFINSCTFGQSQREKRKITFKTKDSKW